MSRRSFPTTMKSNRAQMGAVDRVVASQRDFATKAVCERLDRAYAEDVRRSQERMAAYQPIDLGDGA